jgi:signal transduction histidine kinase
VSHDLKAPLRGILGYAQELERRHQDGLAERARFCIAQIITASRNLDQLIEDLLDYSRFVSEKPQSDEVHLSNLVERILRDRSLVLGEQGVQVDVQVPRLMLRTWERGLHQALSNLIDNALKYSRHATPPRLRIEAEIVEGGCRISVADNGIGFDMKYHDRIFGLCNRLVRASEFEGTGAGLAIVAKLVDKLGGSVRAQSAPGEGATFLIELPYLQPELEPSCVL